MFSEVQLLLNVLSSPITSKCIGKSNYYLMFYEVQLQVNGLASPNMI